MWLYAYSEISYFLVILANNWSIIFATSYCNKSSAVAEMGDRLATIDIGRKVGVVPLFRPLTDINVIASVCVLNLRIKI